MPFALVFVGMLLIVTGFQNTYSQLGTQVQKDFTGSDNFIYWMIAIGVLGAIGYIKDLQTFSRLFMVLVVIGIFLSNKGFFNQINSAIGSGTSEAINPVGASLSTNNVSGSTGSGGGFSLGNIGTDISAVSTLASFF